MILLNQGVWKLWIDRRCRDTGIDGPVRETERDGQRNEERTSNIKETETER